MSFFHTLRPQFFAASFIGLTLLPGVWTFANAPLSDLGTHVMSGEIQRNYEAQFDDNFPMRRALRQAWSAVKFGAFREMAKGAVAGQHGILFTAEEFMPPNNSRDFAAALHTASAQITAAGGELIPVIIPDKARMLPHALPRMRSRQFADRYDHLLRTITTAGLRTVDLRPALSDPQSFMATDTHWSPQGARNVAGQIAELCADDIQSDGPFETTQTGMRDFDGDLLAFADTGVWRSFVGPASEQIATFETQSLHTGDLDLFDDVTTPVVLIGTSFSARADFHFTGFLKSALNADVVSFALEGQGPFVPMDRFLNADTATKITPQIVLWEIPERYLNTWRLSQ